MKGSGRELIRHTLGNMIAVIVAELRSCVDGKRTSVLSKC